MTDMKDRVTAFETKYASDTEILFKIEARACKLFGVWVAENIFHLNDDQANSYGQTLVSQMLKKPGCEAVMNTVRHDCEERNIPHDDDELYTQFRAALDKAEKQIKHS